MGAGRRSPNNLSQIEWILSGSDASVQQMVARHTPDLRHSITHANIKRVWKTMAAGEQFCTADVDLRPELADKVYFSPTVLSLPPMLLTWPATLPSLPTHAEGAVRLPALLARTDVLGAAVSGRNFGAIVNAMIAQRPSETSLTLMASTRSDAHAGEMLLTRRVDYLIGYIADLDEADPNLSRVRRAERPLALSIEGATALAPAGVVCPRTPSGPAAMQRSKGSSRFLRNRRQNSIVDPAANVRSQAAASIEADAGAVLTPEWPSRAAVLSDNRGCRCRPSFRSDLELEAQDVNAFTKDSLKTWTGNIRR